MKLEHIGIAIKNLEESSSLFSELFNIEPYKNEGVESEGVLTTFFKTGESKIELLSATTEDSPIAKFIEKKGEGIHHLAFEVEVINESPKLGADNKRIAFLHPKSTNGVLIELCEEIKNE